MATAIVLSAMLASQHPEVLIKLSNIEEPIPVVTDAAGVRG